MEKEFSWDYPSVGLRVKVERKRQMLTQEKAAAKTNITAQYWSLLENGRNCGSIETYLQIAEALGVTLNDLFYDTADCLSSRLLSSYEDQLSMLTEYERNVVTRVTESTIDIMLQLRKIAKQRCPVSSCNLDEKM